MTPSRQYVEAAKAVQEWIAAQALGLIERQQAEIERLRDKLRAIKTICSGEAKPHWDNSPQTTGTRGLILDICEEPKP